MIQRDERLSTIDRAYGALVGLAIGDALGMPTQSMSAEAIQNAYGTIAGFRDAVAEQPIAPHMTAGRVTDDTEQALLLAHRLVEDCGELDVLAYAKDLLQWEAAMKAKGSFDLLGPSTKAALEALEQGVPPERTGTRGTTNGGAMRCAPVGIAFAPGDKLAHAARRSCIVTHNTVQGIEATTLVAAAVSFGMTGMNPRATLNQAVAFTAQQARTGYWSAKASVLERTRMALEWVTDVGADVDDAAFTRWVRMAVGTSVEANESVPAAFAVAYRYADQPFDALCTAASLGGDTDTIAAMCGAILGACLGADVFGAQHRQMVEQVNGFDLAAVAAQLVALREGSEQ